jgi:predicted nucleic acid-binding protein
LKGWLLDTNVIASLTSPNGAPSVRAWAARQDEDKLFISILTIGEYQKGIHNLPAADPARQRYAAALDALEARFAGRILTVSDAVVRRWGALSGTIRRDTGHPPPVIDTMLAATALEHELCLVTRNVRDVERTGAEVFDPWGA